MADPDEFMELGGVKLPIVPGSLQFQVESIHGTTPPTIVGYANAKAAEMRQRWTEAEELAEVRAISRRHLAALEDESHERAVAWRNWFFTLTRCRPHPDDPPREIPRPSYP